MRCSCQCCGIATAAFWAWVVGTLQLSRQAPLQHVNWMGEFPCNANYKRPSTLQELQEVVAAAPSVRAVGTGCSFNTLTCPKSYGVVVDMRSFTSIEFAAADESLVRVQAGANFGGLMDFLLENGLSTSWHPGNPTFTVGGCLATGCHNMGMTHVDDAVSMTFVTADGSLRTISREDPDWGAAAVSVGRLGVIYEVVMKTHNYAPHTVAHDKIPLRNAAGIIDQLEVEMEKQAANSSQRIRLEFRLEWGSLEEQTYEWTSKAERPKIPLAEGFTRFEAPQYFQLQPQHPPGAILRVGLDALQSLVVGATLGKHVHAWTQWIYANLPEKSKRRHEGRDGDSEVLWGNRYTWANMLDDSVNFLLSLRHVEVIFPLQPRDRALKCMDVFYKYAHLYWFRSYIRMMPGDGHYMSTVHGSKDTWFVRVDFVTPAKILERDEPAFTQDLHEQCPGWRKHWGKSLWTTSSEEPWGDVASFSKVVEEWDPAGKFRPVDWPAWAE